MSCCLSGFKFVAFGFIFVFMISLKPGPFVQSCFDMHAPRQPHAVTQLLSASLYLFSSEGSLLPSILVPLSFSLCMESASYVFPPLWMVLFYLVTTDCFFYTKLCDNSINQSIIAAHKNSQVFCVRFEHLDRSKSEGSSGSLRS